ncbi:hypothetical protein ACET3Z_031533 [Daucus carota]|uniref:Phytosulfokine n=1 Tax=Daucus carota subsp. sativus TaxID=79200 RepID=A0A175YKF3_DAUCS
MSTLTNLCMITFCLLIIAQASARSGGVIADTYIPNNKGDEAAKATSTDENFENCSGLGEEECLMRRTLAAHIDYIYTQNKHN